MRTYFPSQSSRPITLLVIGVAVAILCSACSGLAFGNSPFAEPQTITVNRSFAHPGGVSIALDTVDVTAENTVIGIEINNPRRTQVRINGCCENSYLLDSAGNRYPLAGPPGNPALLVDGEATMRASLVFVGRLSAEAETLQFVFNDRGEGGLNDPDTAWPEMRLGPISVGAGSTSSVGGVSSAPAQSAQSAQPQQQIGQQDGQQQSASVSQADVARPTFQKITIGQRFVHPNSVVFDLNTIETRQDATLINVKIDNPRRIAARINGCCDTSYALDNLGNRYNLVPVPSNRDLLIDGGAAIAANLAFSGQLDANASSVQFIFNDRDEGGLVDPDTSWPEFRLGPFNVAG